MIEVLKQMQKALKEYHYYVIEAGLPNQTMINKGYTAYQAGKQAIAELESQGKTMKVEGPLHVVCQCDKCKAESQEPVAYINVEKRILEWAKLTSWETPTVVNLPKIPLYTYPPQRTWVGLTDAEFREIYETYPIVEEDPWDYERAIELKLKELNT
jgi:hypothetical protein